MRKLLFHILVTVPVLLTFCACDIENIDNGDLDGFWHLEQIDTLATSGSLDLGNSLLFWAFQANLMHTQGATNSHYLRFEQTSTTLRVHSPYRDQGHEDKENGGDIPVEDPTELYPYGIQSLDQTFNIEKLNGSKMVLISDSLKLSFTKF